MRATVIVVAVRLLALAEAVVVPPKEKTPSNGKERLAIESERTDNHSTVPVRTQPPTQELPSASEKRETLLGATTCPPWFLAQHTSDGNTTCVCGSSLYGAVSCNTTTQQAYLRHCFCMSYGEEQSLVVGKCLYSCYHRPLVLDSHYFQLPSNISKLMNPLDCSRHNREGQLCGRCRKGFAPSVNSYGLNCVKCEKNCLNWLKYMAVTFLPLTVFFVIVIAFRVKVTSPSVDGFIFVCQIASIPSYWHIAEVQPKNHIISTLVSLYGIWNLDFFRSLIPPFCLDPKMSAPQAIAMDYLTAAYPLTLIVITYFFVELYDRNVRVVRWVWQPLHKCCTYLRQEWRIKTSLIDVFVTFFLLSYNKFLRVSYDLLVPVHLQNIHGETLNRSYLFLDGTIRYFGNEHLPYAILATVVMSCVIITPCLLLCIYPSRCFQKCLSRYSFRRLVQLNIFMDAFYGHYKDGTNGTRDCRYFAAVYLIMRFAVLTAWSITLTEMYYPIATTVYMVCALSIYVVQPYKSIKFTIINTVLVSTLAFAHLWVIVYYELAYRQTLVTSSSIIINISLLIPLMYGIALSLYRLLGHRRAVQKALNKLQAILLCWNQDSATDPEEPLPYRLVHNEESTALLSPFEQSKHQYGSLNGDNNSEEDEQTY